MNEHFENLCLQGMNREGKTLKDLRKLINKLNHKLAYGKALKKIRDNNSDTSQFTVHNFY